MNVVSLRKQKHELEIILIENDIDIIGLSETRLNEEIEDSEVRINGYCILLHETASLSLSVNCEPSRC